MFYLYYFIWSSQKPYKVIITIISWSTERLNNRSKIKHSQQQVEEVRFESKQSTLEPALHTLLPSLMKTRVFLPVHVSGPQVGISFQYLFLCMSFLKV